MGEPKRIQRKRSKGWRMPEGAVYVGRPTKWGNPWAISDGLTAAECVENYRMREAAFQHMAPDRHAREMDLLRGKDLACWCALDAPCHADVLLSLANPPLRTKP